MTRDPGHSKSLAVLLFGAGILGGFCLLATRSAPRKPPLRHPNRLRASILGASRQMIQSVFGPPRAAANVPLVPPSSTGTSAYWHAKVWYYALDPRRQTAMAIRFTDDRAAAVDFLTAPSLP